MKTESSRHSKSADNLADEEEFLARWSRRKHEARQQQLVDEPATEALSAKIEDAELLTDADMPPLENLTEDSDYSGFLSPGVSEALRKQALRKLFSSPSFNVRDGLDDYDDDFTQFTKLGNTITADMKHQLEMEAQRLQQLAEEQGLVPDTHMTKNTTQLSDEPQQVRETDVDVEPDDVEVEES